MQAGARLAALGFVVAWLFSSRLQGAVPFWLPFLILAAMEAEFVIGGIREHRRGASIPSVTRRLPGEADADLGWIEVVGDDGTPMLVAAPRRLRRRNRTPLLVGLLIAAGLFVFAYRVDRGQSWSSVPAAERARAEQRFSDEATVIAGRAVTVRCDEDYAFTGVGSDAAGVAFISNGLAYLEPGICRTLYRISFERRLGSRDEAAFAITVLAHEAVHLKGVRDEAVTECYALQEGVALAVRLGIDAATAHALLRAQLDRDLSDTSVARVDYRLPAGCREGGELDLRPADSRFP